MEKEILTAIQKEFAGSLNSYLTARDTIDRRIELRRAQIERLKTKAEKLGYNHPSWTEHLLRPLIMEMLKHLPGWHMDEDKRLSPMGLACRVSVFFYLRLDLPSPEKFEDFNSIYIVFIPGQLGKGELFYETGETKDNYQADTIGAINGFNNITKRLESLEEAVQHLKNQIKPQEQL